MKWRRLAGGLAILGAVVCLWLVTRPYGEILDFKKEFDIELPLTVKVSYSEGHYSCWQDGDYTGSLVRVYALSDAQFAEIEKAALAHHWRALPLPEAGLEDIFKQHSIDGAYAEQLPWTLSEGLYMLKPTAFAMYNRTRADESVINYLAQQDEAGEMTSLALGMLDPVRHKVYLLQYDN